MALLHSTEHRHSDNLRSADLIVDAIYAGGRKGNAGDDPFPNLLSVSNMGGFRYRGSVDRMELLVLTSSMNDVDWPDFLDVESGTFTYYGDNKEPGRALHDTPRRGNTILRNIFEKAASPATRFEVPPILIFCNAGDYRDVRFLGLAVPGFDNVINDQLVALWRSSDGQRFQNYRASFTVLDVPIVKRKWLNDIINRADIEVDAPEAWKIWRSTGVAHALKAQRTIAYRTKKEQLPANSEDRSLIRVITEFFESDPHLFEYFAAAVAKMMLPNISSLEVTRPSRDGGRDAVGKLRVGSASSSILIDFALEAKCYGESNGVGVREMARLISRLRHRQFGILVTTSYVDLQAYREIKDDGHPVIILSATDIVAILRNHGLSAPETLYSWLMEEYPFRKPS